MLYSCRAVAESYPTKLRGWLGWILSCLQVKKGIGRVVTGTGSLEDVFPRWGSLYFVACHKVILTGKSPMYRMIYPLMIMFHCYVKLQGNQSNGFKWGSTSIFMVSQLIQTAKCVTPLSLLGSPWSRSCSPRIGKRDVLQLLKSIVSFSLC